MFYFSQWIRRSVNEAVVKVTEQSWILVLSSEFHIDELDEEDVIPSLPIEVVTSETSFISNIGVKWFIIGKSPKGTEIKT